MKDSWKNRLPGGRMHPRRCPPVPGGQRSGPRPPLCVPQCPVLHLGGEGGCVMPKSVTVEAACDKATRS